MNTVLYLVARADNHIPYYEFCDTMEIMSENDLRYFFKTELDAGHIAQANLDDHDWTEQNDPFQADLDQVFSILCDNDEYDENNQYYVSQQEVKIDPQDMYD